MDISIIIVSWNVKELLEKCLLSIYKYTQNVNFEVFVVDNASTDGTADMVNHQFPQLTFIANSKNIGFASANNQAIKMAHGKYILLLNPDTEFIDDSLEKMYLFSSSHPKIGILGPKLLYANRGVQSSIRRFPTFKDQALILLKLHNLFPHLKVFKNYYMSDFKYDRLLEVDQIMGAAMLIRRELFDKLGLLDEKFWLLFEEVDFCKRAKDSGEKIFFYPDSNIVHHKGESFAKQKTIAKQINFNRNLFYYFKKHAPISHLILLWALQPFSLLLAILVNIFDLKRRLGKNKDL